jgi:hypothetical protein
MLEDNVIRNSSASWRFLCRVLVKAGLLLLLVTAISPILSPLPFWSRITLYNSIFPGRNRLPYGDDPPKSFNVTLVNIEAMFASHKLSGSQKTDDDYRVFLIGDSSIWGFLQPPEGTLSSKLNQIEINRRDGKTVRFFNLGYPTMSLLKDLLLLEEGLIYEPDLVLWFVTLESTPKIRQLDAPLVQWNPNRARSLIDQYHLDLSKTDQRFIDQTLWDRTILGSRKIIADHLRFQLYGMMWAATGVDHVVPEKYTLRSEDLPEDVSFHGYYPGDLAQGDLAFDIIEVGMALSGDVPVILINEPIFISPGGGGEDRYNFYYPRWAYDFYREVLRRKSEENGWRLIDLWDFMPPSAFTDTAIHTTEDGAQALAEALLDRLQMDSEP